MSSISGVSNFQSPFGTGAASNSSAGMPFGNLQGDNTLANNFGMAQGVEQANWREAADWNASQAQIARDWSKMMSDTAVQRRVEDLRKAGFSPLSILKMGEASDGTAASATMAKADNAWNSAYDNYLDYLGFRDQSNYREAQIVMKAISTAFNGFQSFMSGLGSVMS